MTDTSRRTSAFNAFPSRRFVEEILLRDGEIPLGIVMTDPAGLVTHWNEFASHLFGWTRDEAIGQPVIELNVGPLDEAQAVEIMERLGGGESWSGTFDCRRKDGSTITVNVLDVPVLGDDGEVVGIVGFSREVVEQFTDTLKALDELRDLANHLDEVRREEQQRISAQLHDQLSQPIAMMATEALRLARNCADGDDAQHIERIGRTLQDALATLQSICTSLRPPGLDEFGPTLAIETAIDAWSATNGVSLDAAIDPELDLVDPTAAEVVVQIITEALANVERHARATRVVVEVTVDGPVCTATIADDGIGYGDAPGFGVRLMTERARRVGGKFAISGLEPPEHGTHVTLAVPVRVR